MYNWFTLLYSRSEPTTVNQLYLSKKKKKILSYSNYEETVSPPQKNKQLFAAFSAANFHRRNPHSLTLRLFLPGSFKALEVGGMGTFLFLMSMYLFSKIY